MFVGKGTGFDDSMSQRVSQAESSRDDEEVKSGKHSGDVGEGEKRDEQQQWRYREDPQDEDDEEEADEGDDEEAMEYDYVEELSDEGALEDGGSPPRRSALLDVPGILDKPEGCSCEIYVEGDTVPVWEYDPDCAVKQEDHPQYKAFYPYNS